MGQRHGGHGGQHGQRGRGEDSSDVLSKDPLGQLV